MNTYKIVLIVWYAIAALYTVATIGRPKKPTRPGEAAVTLVIFAAFTFCVVRA